MYLHRLIQNPVTYQDEDFRENSGEILTCSMEKDNEYCKNAITVFSSSKKMIIFHSHSLELFFH